MGRWEPDAGGRLAKAAMELYAERGFEQTTVAEIAKRAGLTERTFFRHFTDKREVLFFGAAWLKDFVVDAVLAAPAPASPLDAVAAAIEAVGVDFQRGQESVRHRQTIIDAHPELRERELVKMAGVAGAIAGALRKRGVGELAAGLAAEMGIAILKIAFERWIGDPGGPELDAHVREAVGELRAVTAA
jgi:AcrR family transcriptional regulator